MFTASDGLIDNDAGKRIMHDLGFFGYYLHAYQGGRNGKQHVLTELLANGSEMTQRALQDSSCITSASLSEVVAKLEAEGLVTRERSEADRRQLNVALTEAGEQRAREVLHARAEFEAHAFDCLTSDELEQLADTLDRVAARWEELKRA